MLANDPTLLATPKTDVMVNMPWLPFFNDPAACQYDDDGDVRVSHGTQTYHRERIPLSLWSAVRLPRMEAFLIFFSYRYRGLAHAGQ